jgi:hypothetical protein
MLQELPSVVQYNIYISHQIAICIQHIVLDKPAVEVIESKKGLDTFYCIRLFPVIDSLNLVLVNFYTLYAYNKA